MICPFCHAPSRCACRYTHARGLARDGRPAVTPDEIAQAKHLRAEGRSLAEIAAQLGRVKSTVYHMVRA